MVATSPPSTTSSATTAPSIRARVRSVASIASRSARVQRCGRALGDAAPLAIRLHDLRHTHATALLSVGEHPKVVQERLGHATISITLDEYSHVIPQCSGRQPTGSRRHVNRPAGISGVSRGRFGLIESGAEALSFILQELILCPEGDLNPHALLGH